MKEWHYLLTVIDSFVYDKDLEEIVFGEAEEAKKAKSIYENLIKEYNISDENQKWALDIALDCVRQMSDKDRAYLRESYVVDSLEAAIFCLLKSNSYKECVLKAVNLGDDTDTVAAIAGGLAGALYGYDTIPQEWRNTLIKREYIESMCEKAALNWMVKDKEQLNWKF